MDAETKTQWHPAFCSAMRLELRANKENLTYQSEFNLNTKPIQIDLLVIKKPAHVVLDNEIGKLFRGHNIMEYKSPDDLLGVDAYYKTLAYAYLYKSGGEHENAIAIEDVTVSLVREQKPKKLMCWLQRRGHTVEQMFRGIYVVTGDMASVPVQIIVTSELEKTLHVWLASLTRKLRMEEARLLVDSTRQLAGKDERDYADSVLQVTVKENHDIFAIEREDEDMCEALREIMKPELDEAMNKGIEQGIAQGITQGITQGQLKEIYSSVCEGDYGPERGAQKLGISLETFVENIKAAGYTIPENV